MKKLKNVDTQRIGGEKAWGKRKNIKLGHKYYITAVDKDGKKQKYKTTVTGIIELDDGGIVVNSVSERE